MVTPSCKPPERNLPPRFRHPLPEANLRCGLRFLAMRQQVAALCNDRGTDVQWRTVADLGVHILALEGKDLSVATWLTAALWKTSGPAGLADGVLILSDLVKHDWHSMTPPAHAAERRTQMQWLLNYLDERLCAKEKTHATLPAQTHRALVDDWAFLTCNWERHDIELPKFYRMHAKLCSLPVALPEK